VHFSSLLLHRARVFFSALPFALVPSVFAASQTVDSLAALQAAINTAVAGDTITLKDGTYTTSAPISVKRAATAGRPITITAETIGGAEITGTHGFHVTGSAAHVVIAGFKLTHAAGKCSASAGTSNVRFTRNTFACTGDGPYLTIGGDDAQIDYNEFRDKRTVGPMLAVTGTGSQIARRAWIHHNYFHDFAQAHTNGAETLRFGLSGLSLSIGAGIIEHNLFERCNGENELISNKSSGNIYRYNTLLDSPGAQLSLRHGNDCLVYGNYLRNTEGIRIFGDRHRIHGNYLEKNYIGVGLGNGSGEVADGMALTGHDRPDNVVIAFNTFVENRTHYQISKRTPVGLGATGTVFANNLIVGGGLAAKIEGPNSGAVWGGNIVWQTAGAGNLPAEGFLATDPLLVADAAGIFRPQAGSPAIDAAQGDFPAVAVDFEGQPREGAKDIGADEISTAPVVARLLTPADVGPMAKLETAKVVEQPAAPQ
jgi:poly(beta-D-mannuronate) lyase